MEPARKFRIIVNSKECGTCSGSSPSAVAKKVVKKLCGSSSKVVKFSLKECKRGCERECGPYQGRMEKLDKPCKRGGKTITHRVVCGKVRKMKGGHKNINNYIKKVDLIKKFNGELYKKLGFGKHQKYIKGLIREYCYHIIPIFSNTSDSFEDYDLVGDRAKRFEEEFKKLIKDKEKRIRHIYEEVVSEEKDNDHNPYHKLFRTFDISSLHEELKAFIEYLLDKINSLMLEKEQGMEDMNFVFYYRKIRECISAHNRSRLYCLMDQLPTDLFSEIYDELGIELFKKNKNGKRNGIKNNNGNNNNGNNNNGNNNGN
jgi:hypothetical protein